LQRTTRRRRHERRRPFPHDDGEGFDLLLQALPIAFKIILRTYRKAEEEPKARGRCRRSRDAAACRSRSTKFAVAHILGDGMRQCTCFFAESQSL